MICNDMLYEVLLHFDVRNLVTLTRLNSVSNMLAHCILEKSDVHYKYKNKILPLQYHKYVTRIIDYNEHDLIRNISTIPEKIKCLHVDSIYIFCINRFRKHFKLIDHLVVRDVSFPEDFISMVDNDIIKKITITSYSGHMTTNEFNKLLINAQINATIQFRQELIYMNYNKTIYIGSHNLTKIQYEYISVWYELDDLGSFKLKHKTHSDEPIQSSKPLKRNKFIRKPKTQKIKYNKYPKHYRKQHKSYYRRW